MKICTLKLDQYNPGHKMPEEVARRVYTDEGGELLTNDGETVSVVLNVSERQAQELGLGKTITVSIAVGKSA